MSCLLTLFLSFVLLLRLCHHDGVDACYMSASDLGVTSSTTDPLSSINDELNPMFREFRLGLIQEKMLSGLGMVAPPRFVRIAARLRHVQTSSSNDIRRLATLPIRAMQAIPGNSRQTRVLVFSEMVGNMGCHVPNNNRSRTTSLVSFKLPHSIELIRNATLWFHSSTASSSRPSDTNSNTTNHHVSSSPSTKIWLCPCLRNSQSGNTNSGLSDGGCLALHDTGTTTTTRRGMSSVHLTGNWRSFLRNAQGGGQERRILFRVDGKMRVTSRKRPFLVLEIGNDTPKLQYTSASSLFGGPMTGDKRRLRRSVDGEMRATSPKRSFLENGDDTPKSQSLSASSIFGGGSITEDKRRLRRSGSRECRPGTRVADVSSPCCRSSFHVNVTELGWQRWIISPLEFDFYFCAGTCEQGGGSGFAASDLWAARGRDPGPVLQRARMTCCVPRRVSPLPVIITTDGLKVNRTIIPNFQIEECDCFGLR